MARRGFWDSFYQGWEAGDKMGERFRTLAQRRDVANAAKADQEVSSEYSPDQVAALNELTGPKEGETWDEASQSYKDQAGNFRAVANVPEYVNGGFEAQGLGRMTPKQKYTLGSETRDTSFTPDEIREFRANRIADVYDQYDPEKANSLRAQAQQMKLGKVQFENAERQANEAKGVQALMKLYQSKDTMTDEEFMNKLVGITDPMNKDGVTHGFKPMGDGTFEVTQMRNNKIVGSKVVSPQLAFREALKYASPSMYQQITGEEAINRDFEFKAKRAEVTDKQFTDKMAADREQAIWRNDIDVAQHNDRMGLQRQQLDIQQQEANDRGAYWRSGGRGSSASKAKGVGYIKDTGMPVEYDEGVGYYTRGQNGEVVPVSDLRKIVSVGRASAEPDTSIEAGLYEQFKRGLLTPQEYQAALGEIQIDRGIASAFDKLPPKEQAGGLGGAKAPWYMQGKPTVPAATPLQPANPQQILPRNARMGQ